MAISQQSAAANAASILVRDGTFDEPPLACQIRDAARSAQIMPRGHYSLVIKGRDGRGFRVTIDRYSGQGIGRPQRIY